MQNLGKEFVAMIVYVKMFFNHKVRIGDSLVTEYSYYIDAPDIETAKAKAFKHLRDEPAFFILNTINEYGEKTSVEVERVIDKKAEQIEQLRNIEVGYYIKIIKE